MSKDAGGPECPWIAWPKCLPLRCPQRFAALADPRVRGFASTPETTFLGFMFPKAKLCFDMSFPLFLSVTGDMGPLALEHRRPPCQRNELVADEDTCDSRSKTAHSGPQPGVLNFSESSSANNKKFLRVVNLPFHKHGCLQYCLSPEIIMSASRFLFHNAGALS